MSLLKGGTPETEQAFMRALRRLISGNPRHDQNVKLAKCGRLRVTVATVAREAGRSRTLIGSKGLNLNSRRAKSSAFRKARVAWGTRYDSEPST